MADRETITLWARDFFGEITDAHLSFLKDESVVFREKFTNGYMTIEMPNQLEPGVYDIVAERDGAQYRINSFVLPLATLFFKHAHTHDDLKLTGENLKEGEKIEHYKFDPLVHQYLRKMPADMQATFDDISKYSHEQNMVRWGGLITLGEQINISRGEAIVDGKLITWNDVDIPVPQTTATYNVGIKDGEFTTSVDPLDMNFATLFRESHDWIRLNVDLYYHSLFRDSNLYYFTDYEKNSSDIEIELRSNKLGAGVMDDNKIFGPYQLHAPVEDVQLTYNGNEGPVLKTDRLYVYATNEYFLLWDGITLLTALPRFSESSLYLNWEKDLYFTSWGIDGYIRWTSDRPYLPSHIWLFRGSIVAETTIPLQKRILSSRVIADDTYETWGVATRTAGSSLSWDSIGIP